jgi:hypothetical protein
MRKLILAATLLGGFLLPMAPPAEAQRTVIVKTHPTRGRVHRGRWRHGGRWYNHRRFHRGRWVYW